ncbi:orotidine-5'-phosphate decarboxylase [Candidatus Pelagibacter sp.]|nr:orotidine-5'-phosphate decarboxylase [Candidatus Pelagibacter sp.]|tara:strand:- start:540 stop:1217 length:678 start_codon:yes stop_codon:yes gene_type:complete
MSNKNIFVACDVSSQKEIIDLLELIHNDISGIKIGLQYITRSSPQEIKELSKFKKPIFYDGKFFDIKNTLVESIRSLKDLNVNYATVHLLNGLDALKAANQAAQEININLLGVSVLTSFSDDDLNKLGFNNKVENQIERLIKIAIEAKLYGVICSPLEVKMIKRISPKLKCFTPGIRMEDTNDDQKRTMSANEAIKEGSDCLIIGRPITKGDPKENIKYILSSID